MRLVYAEDKELSEVLAELDEASRERGRVFVGEESFCQAKVGVSGVWSNLVSGTSVARIKKPRLVPLMPNLLEPRALTTT